MKKPKKADPLIGAVERSIQRVLSNPKATAREKATARADAIRLLEVKHKIEDPDAGGNFFDPH